MSRFSSTVYDERGHPIPGVTVYVYEWDYPSDTTGALSALTDDDLVTALPNPLTTDEFGEFYFNTDNGLKLIEYHYGGKLLYREQAILTPAGVYPGNDATLRADLAAVGGDELVTAARDETGATSRTLKSKLLDTISVADFGAVGDGSADDTTKLQAAINAAAALGAELYFPKGTYKVTSGLTASVTGAGKSFKITGSGVGASVFALNNSGGAKTILQVTLNDWTNTFEFRDLGFTTNTVNQDSGLVVQCTTPAVAPAITRPSLIDNCTFMGSDGPVTTKYFANNVILDDVSSVNFAHCYFFGYATGAAYPTNGIGVKILGNASPLEYGVVFNFLSCAFTNIGTGIYYGTYAQGVSIATSNFTWCTTGISIPDNTGTGQLSITGSQFACGTYGIHDTGEWGIQVSACYFIIAQPAIGLSNHGIYTSTPNGVTVSSSYFAKSGTGAGTSYGVYATGATVFLASSYTGNSFAGLDYGIYWASSTTVQFSSGNAYASCTHQCWNLGASGMNSNGDAIHRSSTAITLGGTLAAGALTTVDIPLASGLFASTPEKVLADIGDGTVPLRIWCNLSLSTTTNLKMQVYNPTGSTVGVGPYRFNVWAAQA
jgi:hypothetical protein